MKQKQNTQNNTEAMPEDKGNGHTPVEFNKIDISEFSLSLDQQWVNEINKESKIEIIRHYRIHLLYSERLRKQVEMLKADNKKQADTIRELLAARDDD